MGHDGSRTGLALVRVVIGVFLLFEGLDKIAWFADSGLLAKQLAGWLDQANAMNGWYLSTIAIPGVAVFARIVPLAETAAGAALIFGVCTRTAAALAFLMALSFLFASGRLFQPDFLTFGYGLPVLGPLLGLAIGGSNLPWSLRR